jgi:type VI secretion system protein ImpJ
LLSPLPKDKPAPNDFYLLVRRQERDKPRVMEGVRVASPLRLPVVRRQALKGVPYHHVPYPSFPHSFDADIDWYQLTPESDEWQTILREDGLAFAVTPAFEGAQVFLFWRRA